MKEISQLPKAIGASRVAKNILKSERMMWKFLDDPGNILLTNNHAEWQTLHYVIYVKTHILHNRNKEMHSLNG
ncbi:putative transposase-like protein [Wolbachia endosymbiont of Wuchereria bancrofti]|nr:putative transposase-like protein [Wolbachia endosymbiont of Wuchereria bancrofti]